MAAFMDIYLDFEEEVHRKCIYSLSDSKFCKLYRFDKTTFSYIAELVRSDIERSTLRSSSLSCEEQLAAAIRYYATGGFQMDIGTGLHISQSSVHRSVLNVGRALNKHFDQFINWPNAEKLSENKIQFYHVANFPNVIGAIDCTHVKILHDASG